jgi:hypothetical protein
VIKRVMPHHDHADNGHLRSPVARGARRRCWWNRKHDDVEDGISSHENCWWSPTSTANSRHAESCDGMRSSANGQRDGRYARNVGVSGENYTS